MRLFPSLIAFSFVATSSFGAPIPAAKKSELAGIKAAGVLRIATTTEDFPPFMYKDAQGKRAGVDVEIADAIAEKLAVKVEWVSGANYSFKEALDTVHSGKADLALAALFPTLDRMSEVRFSEPYLRIKQILFVQRIRATSLKLPADFEGIVAHPDLVYGYFPDAGTADGMLRRELPAKWVPYERTKPGTEPRDRMIEDFTKGGLTAVWIDEIELEKWRHLKPNLDLYGFAVDVPASEIPLSIAVRRDRPELLEWTNLFLEQAGRGEALKRIYARHRAATVKTPAKAAE